MYSGTNVLSGKPLAELARMARTAHGTKGRCVDYVRNLAAKLARLGISDAAVEEFLKAIEQSPAGRPDRGADALR